MSTCIRTIKPEDNLDARELEKFDIEKKFFQDSGIENWDLVTDQNIPENFIKNIEWFHDCKSINYRRGITYELIDFVTPILYEAIKNGKSSLSHLALIHDEKFGLEKGSCLFIIKYLLANKIWQTDMNDVINPSVPLKIYDVSKDIIK